MSQPFPGLTEADFDAYQPARATSNAYVRPRLETKQKFLDVGRTLAERARAAGVALDVHASDERPSVWNKKSVTEQWLFLWRDRAAREELERGAAGHEKPVTASLLDPTPYYRHAFLALCLDVARFEVALKIHRDAWADVKNVRSRLESPAGRDALTAALHALGEGFVLGVTGGEQVPAHEADAARVGAMLEATVVSGAWLFVARALSRTDAVARGAELARFVDESFDALLPLYRMLAWRREEDVAAVEADLARERLAREAQAAESTARETERLARQSAEIAKRREQALEEARERVAALERPRPAAVHAAVASIPSEPRPAVAPVVSHAPSGPAAPSRGPAAGAQGPRGPGHAPAGARRNDRPDRGAPPAARDRGPRGNHEHNGRRPGGPPREAPHAAPPNAGAGARAPSSGQGGRGAQGSRGPGVAAHGAAVSEAREARVAATGPTQWVDSVSPVCLGARVRIQTGAFAGREGTVIELDARGQAKVSLGLLSARVEARDLITLTEKN